MIKSTAVTLVDYPKMLPDYRFVLTLKTDKQIVFTAFADTRHNQRLAGQLSMLVPNITYAGHFKSTNDPVAQCELLELKSMAVLSHFTLASIKQHQAAVR